MKINTEKLFKILYLTFYAMIFAIVALLLFALLPINGNYKIKIVQSGSMAPEIKTGSIVVIKPSESYTTGDIVMFGKDTKIDTPTTHRIVSSRTAEGVLLFTTKGDANEDNDMAEIKEGDVHGKVLFDVPYFGYIIDIARKPLGFAVLIILPALIVIGDEVNKIFQEIKNRRTKKKDEYIGEIFS